MKNKEVTVLDAIGNTPLIKIENIYAKLADITTFTALITFAARQLQALWGLFLTTCGRKLKVSVFRFQDLAARLPDTS